MEACLCPVAGRGLGSAAAADRSLLLTAASRAYEFWPDALSPAAMPEVRSAHTGKADHGSLLLGLARRHGGRLVTFDRPLAAMAGDDECSAEPACASLRLPRSE